MYRRVSRVDWYSTCRVPRWDRRVSWVDWYSTGGVPRWDRPGTRPLGNVGSMASPSVRRVARGFGGLLIGVVKVQERGTRFGWYQSLPLCQVHTKVLKKVSLH